MDLLVPSILMFVMLGAGFFLVFGFSRWGKRKADESMTMDLRGFSPGSLDGLKAQGLLSDEEIKRIQSVVTERTLEAIRKRETEQESPPDLNTLLGEADRYRRERLKGAEEIEAEMKFDSDTTNDPQAGEET